MSDIGENIVVEISEPVLEEPVLEEPVVEEPVVEEPVVEEPVAEETVVEEPVAEEPVTEETVVEDPVVESFTDHKPLVENTLSVDVTSHDAPALDNTITDTQSVTIPDFQSQLVPKIVFIIPYRDREQQLTFFKKHMEFVLEDVNANDYKTLFIHQCDERAFNRGAMKNIGFLYIKQSYPNDYKNITLVFNDIDTMPYTKNFFNYETTKGRIKHFYGFKYALGGIVSINAGDFENINGFPNFWAWGYEDNLLQRRALNIGYTIDRSQFYPIMDKNIFQMKDGLERLVNRTEFDKFLGLTLEGISNIKSLELEYDENTNFVNVKSFITGTEEVQKQSVTYNLTAGAKPFGDVGSRRGGRARMGMNFF